MSREKAAEKMVRVDGIFFVMGANLFFNMFCSENKILRKCNNNINVNYNFNNNFIIKIRKSSY